MCSRTICTNLLRFRGHRIEDVQMYTLSKIRWESMFQCVFLRMCDCTICELERASALRRGDGGERERKRAEGRTGEARGRAHRGRLRRGDGGKREMERERESESGKGRRGEQEPHRGRLRRGDGGEVDAEGLKHRLPRLHARGGVDDEGAVAGHDHREALGGEVEAREHRPRRRVRELHARVQTSRSRCLAFAVIVACLLLPKKRERARALARDL